MRSRQWQYSWDLLHIMVLVSFVRDPSILEVYLVISVHCSTKSIFKFYVFNFNLCVCSIFSLRQVLLPKLLGFGIQPHSEQSDCGQASCGQRKAQTLCATIRGKAETKGNTLRCFQLFSFFFHFIIFYLRYSYLRFISILFKFFILNITIIQWVNTCNCVLFLCKI